MMAARVASEEKRTPPAAPAAAPPPAGDNWPRRAGAQRARGRRCGPEAGGCRSRPRAPAAAMRRDARNLEAGLTTVSAPGGTVLWMFGAGGRLSRSGDAGATWHEQRSGVTVDLKAGAAPSPATCWIVRSGRHRAAHDGRRAGGSACRSPSRLTSRLSRPSSARAAVVTTRDGRRFETLDGGATWNSRQAPGARLDVTSRAARPEWPCPASLRGGHRVRHRVRQRAGGIKRNRSSQSNARHHGPVGQRD